MDQSVSDYIRRRHNLAIGEQTAEEIKITVGSALPIRDQSSIEIRGRDLLDGLPKNIEIKTNDVVNAITDELREIVQAVKSVLSNTPPELAADVMDKGMIVSGGGALLRNIDELLYQSTGVACYLAEDPLLCVAKGTGVALDNLDIYKRSIMAKK